MKTKKGNHFLKVFFAAFTLVFCIYTYTNIASAAASGNWKDTLLEWRGSSNYQSNGISTDYRAKTNATSCYAYNDKSNVDFTKVTVMSNVPGMLDMYSQDVTYGKPKALPRGEAYYFPNLAYEKGLRKVFLNFYHNNKYGAYIHVWWSPDSI